MLPASLLLGLLVALSPAAASAGLPSCPGDCNRDGIVSINELVTVVYIGLQQLTLDACQAADRDITTRVTIDEMVAAIDASLNGCPDVGPTATPVAGVTASPTVESTAAATATPTVESTAAATTTPTPTAAEPTQVGATPSATTTATAVASAPPVTGTPTLAPTAPPTAAPTTLPPTTLPTASATPSRTASATSVPTDTAIPSATATRTRTATATPTRGPLGTRRFSLDPALSGSLFRGMGAQVSNLGFTGYLDLAAGAPHPVTGLAFIDVVGASDFISLDLHNGTLLCIRPVLPIVHAGVVSCDGGVDLGAKAAQDHRVGEVGAGGFTAQDCLDASGSLESGGLPHPNVCNGPIELGPSDTDTPAVGAVQLAENGDLGTLGLRVQVSIRPPPCQAGVDEQMTTFNFSSGPAIVEIRDANNTPGADLLVNDAGEPFSCTAWTQENGPGRLIQSRPVLHVLNVGGTLVDAANLFVFDD